MFTMTDNGKKFNLCIVCVIGEKILGYKGQQTLAKMPNVMSVNTACTCVMTIIIVDK